MQVNIFEIKCPITDLEEKHHRLLELKADFKGTDHQIDTYFKIPEGRLKLRQGNIENTLIYYDRAETKTIKNSKVVLQKLGTDTKGIKEILTRLHDIWKVVDKSRRIYFVDNVKFHLDEVKGLGSFMEIEAIDEGGHIPADELRTQCDRFIEIFKLDRSSFIDRSYSDMI